MPYNPNIDHGTQDYLSKVQLADSVALALMANEGSTAADVSAKRFAQLVVIAGNTTSPVENVSGVINQSAPALAKHIAVVGNITYIGEAQPGSLTSQAVWRCQAVTDNTTTIDVRWADGNGNFDNVAANITSLIYS